MNGRDGLQVWKVAMNILPVQSRIANKRYSSSLGVGRKEMKNYNDKNCLEGFRTWISSSALSNKRKRIRVYKFGTPSLDLGEKECGTVDWV